MADNSLDFNKTRYTHRDYESLRKDLISIIPSLTQKWTSTEESDPGIVLIKLISMLGDNLSYNMDKMALEMYIESVTQRKNCRKILALLGYKMRWYRSAKVTATVRNMIMSTELSNISGSLIKLVPWETTFKTGSLQYLMVSETDQDTEIINLYPDTGSRSIKLVEGVLNAARFTSANLKNNRYYFNRQNIDEAHLRLLIEQNGNLTEVGKLVENLYLVGDSEHVYFEFNVDEYGTPYIELIDFWRSITGDNPTFVVQYLVTNGEAGNISENAFEILPYGNGSYLYISNLSNSTTTSLDPYNSPGHGPETCDEARKSSANYVFTYDTLVSASDFEKASRRCAGIYNSKLVDGEIIKIDNLDMHELLCRKDDNILFQDYINEETEGDIKTYRMTPYIVILYLIHQDFTQNSYCPSRDEADQEAWFDDPTNATGYNEYVFDPDTETGDWTGQNFFPYKIYDDVLDDVEEALYDNKIMNVETHYGTSKVYPFKVTGTLHFIEPVDPTTMIYIVDQLVTDALKLHFRPDNRKYGQKPSFLEIVDVIHGADDRIKYFDAEGSLIDWVLSGATPPKFDTTSFAKYQGIKETTAETAEGEPGFNIDEKFLRFQITNLTENDLALTAPTGEANCETIDMTIPARDTRYVKCTDIPQVRTLRWYINMGFISYIPEGGSY